MSCFQVYITFFTEVDTGHYTFLTFYAFAMVGFSFVVGQMTENNDRNAFIANLTIKKQKDEIEVKNKEIKGSISYARRIQNAVIPSVPDLNQFISDHFILWLPKDIVSGDFYWVKKIDNRLIIAAADCTGHGVPGAFMSMLGVAFLNELVRNQTMQSASDILEKMREKVKFSLGQTGLSGEQQDGMDMALCIYDTKEKIIQYSGANNSLYLIRNKELKEYKATKNPIGIYLREKPFNNYEIEVQKGDRFYIFSDGFIDQFGGENGRKFMSKRFKETLTEISDLQLNPQKTRLEEILKDWMGNNYKQIDDILVIGIKI